jgi:DNA-binding transcriptional LysR family regulator
VVPLVLAGAGFAFVNRWYAHRAADLGALVRRLDPPIWGRYGLLSRPGTPSPAASAFIEMLVDETTASAQPPPGA